MRFPKRVFIDSSFWLAVLLSGETRHRETVDYFNQLIKSQAKLFTSDYVLSECWTRLIIQQSLSSAKILRQKTKEAERQKQLLIFNTDETIVEKSWTIFEKYADHKLSFTDATIIAYVKDFKIEAILTLDQGFVKAGFTVYPRL